MIAILATGFRNASGGIKIVLNQSKTGHSVDSSFNELLLHLISNLVHNTGPDGRS
jgi:hypothetical protein